MNSLERFVLADGFTKRSWGPWSDDSSVGQSTLPGIGLRIGAGFLPGVGAVLPAGDAINDFSHGRIGSGLLNTGLAGLGVFGLGGVGGAAAKGLGFGARAAGLGARAAGTAARVGTRFAEAAPTMAKGFNMAGRTFSRARGAYNQPFEALSKTRFGAPLNAASKWTGAHPWKSTVGIGAAGAMGNKLDEASAIARQGDNQNVAGAAPAMKAVVSPTSAARRATIH